MADTDPDLAFAALESEAHASLARPWATPPPLAARPLLTVEFFPAFGAHRAWCVFDAEHGGLVLREAAWDRVSDLAAFAEPFPGRERPRPSRPTLAVRDVLVPRTDLEDLLDASESLPLPSGPPLPPYSSGEISSVRFDARPGAPRFRWELEIPSGWEKLAEWTAEARARLEEAMTGRGATR